MTDKTFSYDEMRAAHDAINTAARPAVMMHLVSAFVPHNEGRFRDEHVAAATYDTKAYLRFHAQKIPRTEEAFNTWEGKSHLCNAIILDTLMNVQSEMLGGDDSRADYMPDGLEQAKLITDDSYDGNGFLWYCIENLYRTVHTVEGFNDDDAEHVSEHITAVWDVYLQDCSSSILYDLSLAIHA